MKQYFKQVELKDTKANFYHSNMEQDRLATVFD